MSKSEGVNGMNVLILYFSATGNTAKMAKVIEERFAEVGCKVTMANMTSYENRQEKIDLTPYEAVVFGAPVHSRRAPRVVREWLRTLNGQGKKCSMFFTYGGFGVHPTHYSTRQILEEQHFRVVSSAEFLSAHTFNLGGWKAMEGRPDERDFDVAKEYVERTYTRFINEDENLLGELEKTEYPEELLDAAEASRFKKVTQLPTRGGQECGMCLVCEELCPTGAIKAESGEADKGRCIACLACVANCPEQVLEINDMSKSWPFKLKKENATEESLKEQKSRIYS
ncbi:MAG: EFR1 family ferrodoxin [Candidatus Thorarchaeota archaeon]